MQIIHSIRTLGILNATPQRKWKQWQHPQLKPRWKEFPMRHLQPTITGMAQPIALCVETKPTHITARNLLNINCCIPVFNAAHTVCYNWNALGTSSTTDGTIPVNSNNPFLSECLKRDECQKSPMKICLVVSPPSNKLLQVRQNFPFSTHTHTHIHVGTISPPLRWMRASHTNMSTLKTTGTRLHSDLFQSNKHAQVWTENFHACVRFYYE